MCFRRLFWKEELAADVDSQLASFAASGATMDFDSIMEIKRTAERKTAAREAELEIPQEPFDAEKTAGSIKVFIWEWEHPQTEEAGVKYSISSDWFDDYRAWVDAHNQYQSFSAFIMELIEEKGLDPVDFYRAANMDRKLFSRLKNEPDYHPSKETAVKCCLALKLDSSQTDHVLGLAGYSLSWTLRYDLAIRYCIQHRIFNVFDVEEVLERLELVAGG